MDGVVRSGSRKGEDRVKKQKSPLAVVVCATAVGGFLFSYSPIPFDGPIS